MGGSSDDAANAPAAAPRAYFNHMHLELTLSEVRLDLGQLAPGDAAPAVLGRFTTSPDYLVGMRTRIAGAIDLYQERFGAIAGSAMAGDLEAGRHG